jgi:hypothetical protein
MSGRIEDFSTMFTYTGFFSSVIAFMHFEGSVFEVTGRTKGFPTLHAYRGFLSSVNSVIFGHHSNIRRLSLIVYKHRVFLNCELMFVKATPTKEGFSM